METTRTTTRKKFRPAANSRSGGTGSTNSTTMTAITEATQITTRAAGFWVRSRRMLLTDSVGILLDSIAPVQTGLLGSAEDDTALVQSRGCAPRQRAVDISTRERIPGSRPRVEAASPSASKLYSLMQQSFPSRGPALANET